MAQPLCPAALPLAGPPIGGPAVVCGVLALDREKEEQGRLMEPENHTLFLSTADAKTYFGFCCYRYDDCAIWQAERKRLDEGRPSLLEPDPGMIPEV